MDVVTGFITDQIGIQEALPWEFWEGFITQSIFLTCVFIISFLVSPYLWGSMSAHQKPMWFSTCISMFNPFLVCYTISDSVFEMFSMLFNNSYGFSYMLNDTNNSYLSWKPPISAYKGCGMCVAFFVLDMVPHVVTKTDMMQACRNPSLYWQMVGHHIFSIVLWPYSMMTQKCTMFIVFYMLTEITNVLMNARGLLTLIPEKQGSTLLSTTETAAVVVFTLVRMTTMPLILFLFVPWQWADTTVFQKLIMITTVPIPFALNAFWFSIMFRKALKKFGFIQPTVSNSNRKKRN